MSQEWDNQWKEIQKLAGSKAFKKKFTEFAIARLYDEYKFEFEHQVKQEMDKFVMAVRGELAAKVLGKVLNDKS